MERQNIHPNANVANNVNTIDLTELFFVYLHRWWLIVLVALICAAGTLGYSKFMISPTYASKASIFAVSQNSDSQVTYSDTYLADQLIVDYQEIITTRTVLEETVDKSGYEINYQSLANAISITNAEDSHIIYVTVTTDDPVKSQRLCQVLCEVSVDYIKEITEIKNVKVLDKASYSDTKVGPKNVRNGLIGGLAGAAIVLAILTIIYLADDKVRKPDDIEKKIGWTVLGQIPYLDLKANERL